MDALRLPVSGMPSIQKIKDAIIRKNLPVNIWGLKDSARTLIMDYLRDADKHLLIVTWDDNRAEQLCQDFQAFFRETYTCPAKDVLFYAADIHGNLTARKRMDVIRRLRAEKPTVVVLTVEGLMDRIPEMHHMEENILHLAVDQEMEMKDLSKKLLCMGYEHTEYVEVAGQFSYRGGILDIFPLTEEIPVRIEFWGDEITSIRSFDAGSQKAKAEVSGVEILPATEFVMDEKMVAEGIARIDVDYHEAVNSFKTAKKKEEYERLIKNIEKLKDELKYSTGSSKVDSYVNYFFEDTVSFLDFFPEDTMVMVEEPGRVAETAKSCFQNFQTSMQSRIEGGYNLPGGAGLLFTDEEIMKKLESKTLVTFSAFMSSNDVWLVKKEYSVEIPIRGVSYYGGRLDEVVEDIRKYQKEEYSVLFVAPTKTRGELWAKELMDRGVPTFFLMDETRVLEPREIMVTRGGIEQGFDLPEAKLVVITENELQHKDRVRTRRRRKRFSGGEEISNLGDLQVGDYVVHESYGIGVYSGIKQMETDGRLRDYLSIIYEGGDELNIPVDKFFMIGKYADKSAAAPKLNRLGTKQWSRTCEKVKGHVEQIAEELIELYADRMNREGHQFGEDDTDQTEFEDSFEFEETQDQLDALEDIKRDMQSPRIMDRLICGDVGFGKTELAIRAAFKCASQGLQVAYLVPTTILAQQHYDTFKERMDYYGFTICLLSRFSTPGDTRDTLDGLKNGTVDIVIGTHRLLSKDVKFKQLGLLIIDEEQRFGVKDKEKIKQMKSTVDVLTLTATPIPRTLHMSLVGIRDMSLLREPPVDRRPIQTYVMEYDPEMVKEACNRELSRDGQVFYVYNKVEDIDKIADGLRNLLPEAEIEVAHGQMSPKELEEIMRDFVNHEIDILVTTTIIETGLDIPNANTIIIQNADRFGLAQLYQLRGRVGRSGKNAYAYLMYRQDRTIKEVAEKRLSAIREFTELGSGYKISLKDLELRGAGNVLGGEQSGHMMEVGYDLYCKMLSTAIRKKQEGDEDEESQEEDFDTSIDLPIDAYIPDPYVKSEYMKLELYKRISKIQTREDMELIEEEMKDRFGSAEPIPKMVENLLRIALLKTVAHKAGILKIRYIDGEVQYIIKNGTPVLAEKIPELFNRFKGMHLYTSKESGIARPHSRLIQEDLLDEIEEEVKAIWETIIPKKRD